MLELQSLFPETCNGEWQPPCWAILIKVVMPLTRWSVLAVAAVPLVVSILRPAPAPSLEWWPAHALEKVRPFDRARPDVERTVKIKAARNEFEPFQLVLRAEGQGIDGVDVEVTDLR